MRGKRWREDSAEKGRVVVIGMTCFGAPAKTQTPFWQWRSWVLLLRDLAWWAAGRDEHFL